MSSLKDVIGALRRELDEALGGVGTAADGVHLAAERVVLTLELAVRDVSGRSGADAVGIDVLAAEVGAPGGVAVKGDGAPAHTHTLTLEFRCGRDAPTGAGRSPADVGALPGLELGRGSKPSDPDIDPVPVLSRVFGSPGGFDSHCRAETFLTAVGELSDDEYAALPGALASGRSGPPADRLAHACAQVGNILRSGPMQSMALGAEMLRSVLSGVERHTLRALIARTWRNGELSVGGADRPPADVGESG